MMAHDDRRGRLFRLTALGALPVAALAAAWWFTRTPAAPPAAGGGMSGHDHAAMAGMGGGDGAQPVRLTVDQARRIGVTFAAVTDAPLDREVRTVGQVTFDETRQQVVAPRVEGWVEQLYVDFTGRAVRRGEPLLRIYSPMLVTAQAELLLAKRLVTEVAGAPDATRRHAEELLQAARRRLEHLELPAEQVATLERTGEVQRTVLLRATATGIVTERNVTQGQRIMAGDAILRVVDLSTVWIEGDVYEQDLRAVRTGQEAVAEFDAFPGERFTGRVSYIAPMLATETRTARIRVVMTNPGLRLKPGMYATLRVTGSSVGTAPVLSVPRGAVLTTGERSLVFVRRSDGQLEPRVVTTGSSSAARIEIVSGLAAGDTVVASATFLLDAESNLGTALGGMGDMPGMEITSPPRASRDTARRAKSPHEGH